MSLFSQVILKAGEAVSQAGIEYGKNKLQQHSQKRQDQKQQQQQAQQELLQQQQYLQQQQQQQYHHASQQTQQQHQYYQSSQQAQQQQPSYPDQPQQAPQYSPDPAQQYQALRPDHARSYSQPHQLSPPPGQQYEYTSRDAPVSQAQEPPPAFDSPTRPATYQQMQQDHAQLLKQLEEQEERERARAEKLQADYRAQLLAAQQEADRLQQEAKERLEQAHREAERLRQQAEVDFEQKRQQRELLRKQYEMQMEYERQEAEKLRREAENLMEHERRVREKAQFDLAEQIKADQMMAEKLAAQYQNEYETELQQANEEMQKLGLENQQQFHAADVELDRQLNELKAQQPTIHVEEDQSPPMPPRRPSNSDAQGPPMPPRPVSWTPGYNATAPPPPPLQPQQPFQRQPSPYLNKHQTRAEAVRTTVPSPGHQVPNVEFPPPPTDSPSQQQFQRQPSPYANAHQPGTESFRTSVSNSGQQAPPPQQSSATPTPQSTTSPQQPLYRESSPYANTHQSHNEGFSTRPNPGQKTPRTEHAPPPSQPPTPQQPFQRQSSPYVNNHQSGSEGFTATPSPGQQTRRAEYPPPPTQPSAAPSPQAEAPPPASTRDFTTPKPRARPTAPKQHACGTTPVRDCINIPVTWKTDYFVHTAAPNFYVCSRCYVDHVYSTMFGKSFVKVTLGDDGTRRRCHFGTERFKDVMWPAALSLSSMDSAIQYMKLRQNITDCVQGTTLEGGTWYTSPDLPDTDFCPACYEDIIAASPFAHKFSPSRPSEPRVCDSAVFYISRLFDNPTKIKKDWGDFTKALITRTSLPPCPKGAVIEVNTRPLWASKRGPVGLVMCEACYHDYFFETPSAQAFERQPLNKIKTTCTLAILNIMIPAQEAVGKDDPGLFWQAVDQVDANEFCNPGGTKGAKWYTLPNNPAGFGICGGCKAGIADSLNGGHHFVPKTDGPGRSETYICNFNSGHLRAGQNLVKFSECLFKGTWEPLGEYTAVMGNVPRCNGLNYDIAKGRQFWGWDNCCICAECYHSFAKGSALEALYTRRGEADPKGRTCDMYSTRMRTLYRDAGTPGSGTTFEEFAKFCNHRMQVYMETVPQMQNLVNQQKINAMQAINLGNQGLFNKSIGGSVDATMGHSYTVGNSYAGYGHANEWMLRGETQLRQSREMFNNSHAPMFEVQRLEFRWKQVE